VLFRSLLCEMCSVAGDSELCVCVLLAGEPAKQGKQLSVCRLKRSAPVLPPLYCLGIFGYGKHEKYN